jgi:hypothetical protein
MVSSHQDKEVMPAGLLQSRYQDFQQHISYQEEL